MKKNKLLSMALVSLVAAITFDACTKDDDIGATSHIKNGILEAAVEGDIVDADAEIRAELFYDNRQVEVGDGDYNDGWLTLALDEPIPDRYLEPAGDNIPGNVKVSNPNAGIATAEVCAWVEAYIAGDVEEYRIGEFYYGTAEWEGLPVYANSDVSITGSYTETESGIESAVTLNVHLEKGWNMVYTNVKSSGRVSNVTVTTKAPSGTKKWYYILY